MIAPRHLTHAPITEAIIDFQATLPEESSLDSFSHIHDLIKENYPSVKPIHQNVLGFQINENESPRTTYDHTSIGYRYESHDKTKIAQFKTNGFSFSRLEPYTTWEDMENDARTLWNYYVEATSPIAITRVATRYINVLKVPLPIENFDDFLTAAPRIPNGLPQGLISFLSRLVVPDPSLDAIAIITQALEKIESDHAPIVIDIDAFINKHFDVESNLYWECLKDLREYKNRVFFESITEKTAELFI